MAINQSDQLKTAIADARSLLAFAITSHRRLEDKIVDEVMKTIEALGDLATAVPVPLEKEAAFWKAYQALTQATVPVSAASIDASTKAAAMGWGTTAHHALIALLVFIVLAAAQVTWVVGTNLRKDLDASEVEIAAQEDKRRPLEVQLQVISDELQSLGVSDVPSEVPVQKVVKLSAAADKQVKELQAKRANLTQQQKQLDETLSALRNSRKPLVNLIQGWYSGITRGVWHPGAIQTIADLQGRLDKANQNLKGVASREPAALLSLFAARREARQLAVEMDQARDQLVVELKHRTDLILDGLQRYLFPVLLGLLGALTFILRSLITQIREFTYTPNYSSLSFMRASLGMMAGLFGTMFIPQTDNVLKSLPPLALPFLFGYAVEVLFSFLDRVVKAFVDDRATAK